MKSSLLSGMRLAGVPDSVLTEHAMQRYRDLRSHMEGSEWWRKREKYERIAKSDFSDRLSADPTRQTIFDKSNESLQLIRSIRRFLLARTHKDLFGSSPWFAVKPKPQAGGLAALITPQVLDSIQPHAESCLKAAGYQRFTKEAIGIALDLGECAMKTTWRVEVDKSERLATILFDSATGQPVITADGDYIFEDDESSEAETPEEEAAEPMEEPPGAPMPMGGGEGAMEGAGRVFAKAPEILWQESFEWKEHLIEENKRTYAGLHVSTCYWKDVYWELNKPCLEESDVVHVYDMTLSELAATYDRDGDNPTVAEALERLRHYSPNPKSEATKPRREVGEPELQSTDTANPVVRVAEMYLDFDLFGDGVRRRLQVVVAVDEQLLIWAEYRAAMSPGAKKPIHILTLNKLEQRAYGRGLYESFEDAARAMDRLLNQIMVRNDRAVFPTVFWNPEKTKEGRIDPHFRVGPDKSYAVEGQASATDILRVVEFPAVDPMTWQLMQLYMQLVQVESGVTNSAQSAVSQLEENKTATATNAMTEVSAVLHLHIVEELRDGFLPQLTYAIELVYFRMDDDDPYSESEEEGLKMMALADARQLADIPMAVDIVLTRIRRQEMREAAVAAIPTVTSYYDQLAQVPGLQEAALRWKVEKTQPLYEQVLRGLEIDNADEYFPAREEIEQAMAAFAQQQAAMAQQAQLEEQAQASAAGQPPLPDNVIADTGAEGAPAQAEPALQPA